LQHLSANKELSRDGGKSLPVIAFWELVKDRIRSRTLATTLDGYIALIPMKAPPGDILALFRGGEVPFLLRRADPDLSSH